MYSLDFFDHLNFLALKASIESSVYCGIPPFSASIFGSLGESSRGIH